MATYSLRGINSHSVIYSYVEPDGKRKQQWETYDTELEAMQRKAHIDYLQDKLLHLVVHLAFVCSLRAGETTGISINTIDFHDRSLWITQEVQRVSDDSLSELPKNEIIRIFPKDVAASRSSLILKGPKTEGSVRKQYLTTPLLYEIRTRLDEIRSNKEFFGSEYKDYGLLICKPDGRPVDPKDINN